MASVEPSSESLRSNLVQLESLHKKLAENPGLHPEIIEQTLLILFASEEPSIISWVLGFLNSITSPHSFLSMEVRKSISWTLLDQFSQKIEDNMSEIVSNNFYLIFSNSKSSTLFISTVINIYELSLANLVDLTKSPNTTNESLSLLKLNWLKTLNLIKEYLFTVEWNEQDGLLIPIKENNLEDFGFSPTKAMISKFIFKIIDIQADFLKDPRKKTQNICPIEDLNKFNLVAFNDSRLLFNQEEISSLIEESKKLLNYMISLLVFKKKLDCQMFSSICFLIIKLLQKRPNYFKLIGTDILKINLDTILPNNEESSLFINDETNFKDNFNRLKFKLNKRFSYRSLKILIDYFFRYGHLNPYLKKDSIPDLSKLNEFDKMSIDYLDKINSIIGTQHFEKLQRNLLINLPNQDNFDHIINRQKVIKEQKQNRLIEEQEIIMQSQIIEEDEEDAYVVSVDPDTIYSLSELYESVNSEIVNKIDLSLLPMNVLVSIILKSLEKVSSKYLTKVLESIGDTYVDLMEKAEQLKVERVLKQEQRKVKAYQPINQLRAHNQQTVNYQPNGNYQTVGPQFGVTNNYNSQLVNPQPTNQYNSLGYNPLGYKPELKSYENGGTGYTGINSMQHKVGKKKRRNKQRHRKVNKNPLTNDVVSQIDNNLNDDNNKPKLKSYYSNNFFNKNNNNNDDVAIDYDDDTTYKSTNTNDDDYDPTAEMFQY